MSDFKQNFPNYLTTLRVVLIPFLILAFYLEKDQVKIVSCLIFTIAAISDFLDGYLSRKWQVTSRYGAMLDPIADKLIVATALCLIISQEIGMVIPAIAIICREIFISGLREFLGKSGNIEMPVTNLAKWKTTSQLVAVIFLLLTSGNILAPSVTIQALFYVGAVLLWVSTVLTLYTGYKYYDHARKLELV